MPMNMGGQECLSLCLHVLTYIHQHFRLHLYVIIVWLYSAGRMLVTSNALHKSIITTVAIIIIHIAICILRTVHCAMVLFIIISVLKTLTVDNDIITLTVDNIITLTVDNDITLTVDNDITPTVDNDIITLTVDNDIVTLTVDNDIITLTLDNDITLTVDNDIITLTLDNDITLTVDNDIITLTVDNDIITLTLDNDITLTADNDIITLTVDNDIITLFTVIALQMLPGNIAQYDDNVECHSHLVSADLWDYNKDIDQVVNVTTWRYTVLLTNFTIPAQKESSSGGSQRHSRKQVQVHGL